MPSRVLERIRHNLGLKLLSLVLAIAAWAYLRFTPNPVIAARFVQQMSVSITTIGLEPDEVARLGDHQVVASVYVPRGAATIRPEEIRAVLHLEGREPGIYNIPVEVIAPKLEIKSLSPASITLAIERIERRNFPVAIHYVGSLARGSVVVKSISVEPRTVELRAATSDLARVNSVRVDVPLPSAATTFDAMVRPIAADVSGTEVSATDLTPNLVRIRAAFVAARRPK